MGLCFSKKKKKNHETESSSLQIQKSVNEKEAVVIPQTVLQEKSAASVIPEDKKPVFVITQNKKTSSSSASNTTTASTTTSTTSSASEEKLSNGSNKKSETPKKKNTTTTVNVIQETACRGVLKSSVLEQIVPQIPVRTSSCTKEELDAILIHCGRLSRSSSGNASASYETPGRRRYSGSKRSYDFDERSRKAEEDDDWEKPVSRPSPRRRTPSRERGDGEHYKRSGSRERSNSGNGHGSRRASRSPGRRSDGPGFAAGDRSKQPGKMVSVPAREKPSSAVPDASTMVKRASSPSVRSQSPANTRASNENGILQPQSLSRSSSRKAEQSPHRRNPLAELDENSLRADQQHHPSKKPISQSQKLCDQNNPQARKLDQKFTGVGYENATGTNKTSSKAPLPESVIAEEEAKQTMAPENSPRAVARSRSSRRSSRDLDNLLGLNPESILKPNSYNSLLLEDIHNYHHQNNINTTFTLPACVSKACSILEAVADLNSDNRSDASLSSIAANEPFLESQIVVKNDILEPSLRKYVTVRGFADETEPQESAGSNSFVGQPWTASPREPNSVDSTDRCQTSQSNATAEEAEKEELSPPESFWNKNQHQQLQQQQSLQVCRGRRMRASSCANNLPATGSASSNRRRNQLDHKQVNNNRGSAGGRVGSVSSAPVAATASS